MHKTFLFSLLFFILDFQTLLKFSAQPTDDIWDFDGQLQIYFEAETRRLSDATTRRLHSITDWESYRKDAVDQVLYMLGLDPRPVKTPLHAVITGTVDHEDFVVEKLYFQSMPGLYVTGNLYRPKKIDKPLPAIIYVCGHSNVKEDEISYGSKVVYQHHPAWFARHGYICLILDTLQLGEIEGIHHGLYRYGRWWWMPRGYTPAGVETWNGIRAIDYLISRTDVDPDKIGITGRSGGGATSWWVAVVDDRVKAAVPVAGITDLTNHIIHGCVDGHCDCMYFVNTFEWDYPMLAALIAPRPLLISNTDRDPIFPLDGVYRTYTQVREVYEYIGEPDQVALNTAAGSHMDIQPLQIHAFKWFDKYLHQRDALIEKAAIKYFSPQQLKVFDNLPEDQINTRIDELFVPMAPPSTQSIEKSSWEIIRQSWFGSLEKYVFAGWPQNRPAPQLEHIKTIKKADVECMIWRLSTDTHTHFAAASLEKRVEDK